jgi:hypothetical protein
MVGMARVARAAARPSPDKSRDEVVSPFKELVTPGGIILPPRFADDDIVEWLEHRWGRGEEVTSSRLNDYQVIIRAGDEAGVVFLHEWMERLHKTREFLEGHSPVPGSVLGTLLDESETPGYTDNLMDKAAIIRAAAQALSRVYPAERVGKALEYLETADTERETTAARATEPPRTDETAPVVAPSPKVQAVFGDIPAEFHTKRHSKTIIPEDTIHDPEVVETAREIVNANRRKKIKTLAPKAQATLRIARRIVRANEGQTLA